MSSMTRRLHLDDVVTSFPELGPSVPDGGYSWIVLIGVLLVQMTVPTILSMYGIALGYLAKNSTGDFELWNEKIVLTPILFTAFWSLADPWTKTIVSMASIPRLVGIIGVALLSVGVVASGYLATGGVGAYLASSSAGAVMGIGASFVILQSEHMLRKYFRTRLLLALTLKNIGASLGLLFVPGLTYLLLNKTGLKEGLLLMTLLFLPTGLGTLTFRSPAPQRASPYRLLLSTEEDNELPIRITPDINKESRQGNDGLENFGYGETEDRQEVGPLFSEGNNMYSYQEPDEEVDLFVSPIANSQGKWKQQFRALKNFRLWAVAICWIGVRVSTLFFWTLLPTLSLTKTTTMYSAGWMALSVAAGFATLLPSIISYKVLILTGPNRRLYFGVASGLSGFVLIGLTCVTSYTWIMTCALLGGISIGGLSSCQDLALYDVLGAEAARRSHKGFSTLVGLFVLLFCFVHDVNFCLLLAAFLQFFGGLYLVSSPVLDLIKARRQRLLHGTNRTTRNEM